MLKELVLFTIRFSSSQRFCVINNKAPEDPDFFDSNYLLEHFGEISERHRQPGLVHNTGGNIIMISYPGCFFTVMAV